jgi:hypothetical protein
MADKIIPERDWSQVFKEDKPIDFHRSQRDSGHYIVKRFLDDGSKEIIGHVYLEVDGDYMKYFSTNSRGREIFPPTYDFNEVDKRFTRYAHLRALQQRNINKQQVISHSQFKNPNTMNNPKSNSEQKTKKENQLIFIEYEKATRDGHNITVVDSYHNVIGRGHKLYNDLTKRYEYVAYDHAGNLMFKADKQWELKNEFVKNRTHLLEEAHQRRIASKEQSKQNRENGKEEKTTEKQFRNRPMNKSEERKRETEKLREDKTGKNKDRALEKVDTKSNDKAIGKDDGRTNARENEPAKDEQSRQDEREQELEDLRDEQDDDRGDMDR